MSQDYEKAVNVITAIDSMMKSKSGKFKTLALTAVLLLSAFGASAQTACPDSLWQAGVDAYSAGDWQTAAIKWSELMDNGTENAELYYNLGNAFFKQGETACAILNYERALKLDPSFTDARFNLEFVNQGIRDKVEAVPEFFLRTWMRNLGYLMSSNAWTVLFFVFFATFVAALLLFALSGSQALRKTGFFSSIALLLLAVLAVSFAFSQRKDYMSNESAVIMSPVVSVKSAPGDDSVELFVIHEGLKVKVTDELSTCSSIEIPDGRKGWIKSAEKENI